MVGAAELHSRYEVSADRPALRVELTGAARRALDAREEPLVVEMELFFSCLVRKRVRWGRAPADAAPWLAPEAHGKLRIWFHPVMSQHCALPATNDLEALPLIDFPLARRGAFCPRWLRIDYRSGDFQGDFGW